jgi:hypothetical protein
MEKDDRRAIPSPPIRPRHPQTRVDVDRSGGSARCLTPKRVLHHPKPRCCPLGAPPTNTTPGSVGGAAFGHAALNTTTIATAMSARPDDAQICRYAPQERRIGQYADVSLSADQLAEEAVRLCTAPDPQGGVYYDNLWPTVLRHMGGIPTDERAKRLAGRSGNNVSLLRTAGALLRRRPETPERRLALSLIDLAVLRAGRSD